MNYRKELKRRGRASLKRHYALWVVLCLLMLVLSGNRLFLYSVDLVESSMGNTEEEERGRLNQIIRDLASGNREAGRMRTQENEKEDVKRSREKKDEVPGRSEGVLSGIVNRIMSGGFLVSLTAGISSIVGSDSVALMLLIFLGILVIFSIWFLTVNIYKVIVIRIFLEGQQYEAVHISRVLYLIKVQKWLNACWTMFVLQVYTVLWWMTIIGGVIKRYSYFLVPYIVAENPDIHAGEAITLSRKMMNGHKWECFVLQLSFLGWNILGMVTGGLVALFFKNPYQTAVNCEYYGMLRRLGKEAKIPDTELLNDEYLFVRPEEQELQDVYVDVARETGGLNTVKGFTGVRGLLAKYFGVVADWGEKELEYEKEQAIRMRYAVERQALDGKIYPARMCPLPEKESRSDFAGVSYLRCYSIWSLIMIFMIMSVGGWIWEVSLHLITDGEFVNRGVLHGPWLPIYGTGSVLILMLLYRFRRNPALEFSMVIAVCGLVEYFTAYFLELIHGGQKWWDYTGYFLNLHGRVCAEGLLVFGVGGMMIVYVLAPLLDKLIRKLPSRLLVLLGVFLLSALLADRLYSIRNPNTGKGITSETEKWY